MHILLVRQRASQSAYATRLLGPDLEALCKYLLTGAKAMHILLVRHCASQSVYAIRLPAPDLEILYEYLLPGVKPCIFSWFASVLHKVHSQHGFWPRIWKNCVSTYFQM